MPYSPGDAIIYTREDATTITGVVRSIIESGVSYKVAIHDGLDGAEGLVLVATEADLDPA